MHLPALLELIRSTEGKPLREGDRTQDRHVLIEKGAGSRRLPRRRGGALMEPAEPWAEWLMGEIIVMATKRF